MAEDVKNRIHDEPGPGKTFMSSFVSEKPHNLFFSNTEYLNAWRKAGKRQRPHLPGHNYFSLVDEIRQTHLEVGELYMEFSTCDSLDCPNNCVENPYPKIDPVPRPLPDSSTDHYKTYENTPSLGADGKPRPIDDYQPRKQCTIQYEKGLIAIDKPTKIDSFCSKYLVKKNNVLEHLNHKAYLNLKKTNRKKARESVNQVNSEDDLSGDTNEDNDTVFAEKDDVILNEVGESEDEDESDDQDDENNLTFVPQMTTVTRHGRSAGAWNSFLNRA